MNKTTSVILQPEYVEHFQFDGNKCNAKCFKSGALTLILIPIKNIRE